MTAPSLAHTPRMPAHGWFTISRRTPRYAFTHCSNGALYPLSAQITWSRGSLPASGRSNTFPPSRSPRSAASTLTDSSNPWVSTNRCRFRPKISSESSLNRVEKETKKVLLRVRRPAFSPRDEAKEQETQASWVGVRVTWYPSCSSCLVNRRSLSC